ncbi:MAG: hypothetical protein ACJ0BO_05800, partial [Candidatus Puniceispirillaceae bacterium]
MLKNVPNKDRFSFYIESEFKVTSHNSYFDLLKMEVALVISKVGNPTKRVMNPMNILIPFNSQYLTERYNMNSDFLEQLSSEVLPHILNRFSSDERVKSIEIITDLGLERVCEPYSKTVLTRADIGPLQESNEVVKTLLAVRKMQSAIVVQANLLYPFINVNSLYQGYLQVKRRVVSSALGSSVN